MTDAELPAENAVKDTPKGNAGVTDFEFYAKFAKHLILSLNCTEDRILAASWFSKLRDEASGPEHLRLDYLKLLLFVLQRHRLTGPFTQNPNAQEYLEEFGEDYELAAVARKIIEKEQEEKKENHLKRMRGEVGDWPPYSTDYSADLKEYVAAQDIPSFGVHVYYAISKDPILDWDRSEHAVVPRGVRRMEPQGRLSETSFAIIEPRPETPDEGDKCKILEETGVMPDMSIFLGRKTRARKSPYKDIDRPAPPLGILPGEGQEGLAEDGLPPPTWGSNLIEVREPLESEGPETPPETEVSPSEVGLTGGISEKSIWDRREPGAEDPEIINLLETSFNMEDILAEVDAMETEEPPPQEDVVDPMILEEQRKFREIEADMDRHDAAIAEALASLDDDERRMLMEMEAEEAAGLEPRPKPAPKKEVKVVADDDTVIKVLVENPEGVIETKEEADRKEAKAAADKKKKPPGRTGLNKGKAKGAILKPGEKKEVEEQEKKAKVVDTKTGVPSKRPGVPKTKASKAKISAAASEGEIPSEKPSGTGKGKAIPGKGVPKKGIPKKGAKAATGTAEMKEMKERLDQKLQETKDAYPDKFAAEQMAGPSGVQVMEEAGAERRTPIDDIATSLSPGSPEADDIYDEMDREYQILERLYELYEQLAPDKPDALRTPPLFSKHPEIRELGRQLRYRTDEFQVHPAEKFKPAAQYFAGEGAAAPSPFVEPREATRMGLPPPEVSVSPEQLPARRMVESPPWSKIEELKRITQQAERGLDESPAISAGVAITTPKTPSTPRRPVRTNLMSEIAMESPPPYESPPGSPEEMRTPEFLRDPALDLPEVWTIDMLDKMHPEKQAEYEAYIQAEMEDERAKWPILAPKAPTPPPPQPQASPAYVSPGAPGPARTPPQPRVSPRMPTPPSVGAPGTVARTPGTPEGLPPSMRYQYVTPPQYRAKPEKFVMPEVVFEKFDPLQYEDIIYQTMPDLVEADLDDFDTQMVSPQFELKEWYDPMKAILAAEEEPGMFLDMSEEMPDFDLVPTEEDYAQFSPAITLQERLMKHEIPKDFYDPTRPEARAKQVRIGYERPEKPRKYKPTQLAEKEIQEDLSGEEFEQYEDLINAEMGEFINVTLGDPDRIEYMKKMADEAQDIGALSEEEPPELYEMDMSFGPPSPEKPPEPSPVIQTPPFGRGMDVLLFGGPAEAYDDMFIEEEPDFLASPGMPSPPPPPTPPPRPVTPPWAPPFGTFYADDIFADQDESFLASPGMPPGKTFEDELREIGSPIKLPPPSWELPPPPPPQQQIQIPMGPFDRPVGPAEVQVSPPRVTAQGVPIARRRPPTPVGTPELDPEAFRREMMQRRVDFAKKQEFQAGQRKIQRRTPLARPYFPIREHAGYEESERIHAEMPEDYRELMSRLPPAPPPAAYPEELLGYEHEGQFAYEETLLDQPLPPTERLPSPMAPKRDMIGWQTPPHQKFVRPVIASRTPSPPPRYPPDIFMRLGAARRRLFGTDDQDIMGLREEDIFPEELQESIGSPRVPTSLMMTPTEPPPSMAIPTMTMGQQMMQAEQRAQWQAQQIAERTPPRPPSPARPVSPARPPSPERPVSPTRQPQPAPRMPSPPPADQRTSPASGLPPCSRPQPPKVLKRVQEMSYTSEVYDPDSPENSRKWTKGRTMLEFNRPEEGDRRRPVVTPPSQGVAVYPRGPPVSAHVSPVAMPMPMPTPEQRPMPQRRPRARIPRPVQAGGTPRIQGGRLPRRNILEGEGMPVRRRLFPDVGEPQPLPSRPPSPTRVCPGAPQGERVEIVEDFEETEHDYIPEHLRGYRWIDEPEEDDFYRSFRQQFQ